MKILALVGPGSCGKTTTINLVYKDLIDKGATSKNKKQEGGNKMDFSAEVTWNGKLICFLSMGDYSGYLIDAIGKYDNLKCDIFICACNNRFKNPFKVFAKYHNKITIKTIGIKGDVAHNSKINTSDMQTIISYI
jgi:GTPase SAR1 family protein